MKHHFQLMHILFRQYYRNFIGYNLFVVDLFYDFYPHPCFLMTHVMALIMI